MALSIELKRRLNNDEEALPKRIRLAEDVFNSQRFPLTTRRNIVLQWLCDVSASCTDIEQWIESVKKCFAITFANTDIDLPVKQSLLKICEERLDNTPSIEILECFTCIITHLSMRQYLISNLDVLVKALRSVIININTLFSDDNLILNDKLKCVLTVIMNHVVECYKYSTDGTQFYINVLYKIMQNLIKSLYLFEDENLDNKCNYLLEQCIFTKCADPINQYIELLKLSREKHIRKYLMILTTAFVSSFKDKSQNIFKLYKHLFEMDNHILSVQNHHVMINILIKANVSLEVELDNESFLMFLQKYSMKLLITDENSMENVLCILSSIVLLNPLIIETQVHEIVVRTMLREKLNDSCSNKFISFLQLIIQALVKLNRVHKLPILLLHELKIAFQMKSIIHENSETSNYKAVNVKALDVESVWPLEISKCWGNAMKGLSVSLTLRTLKALLYNLENNCIICLETHCDLPSVVLMTQITLRFIDSFLMNCELPIASKTNFVKINENIKQALQTLAKIAEIIIKMKINALLYNWLHTVFVTGEFSLLVEFYWKSLDDQFKIPLIDDYLSNKNWKKIVSMINKSESRDCKYILNQIPLQSLRSTILTSNPNKDGLKISPEEIIDSSLHTWDQFLSSKMNFKIIYPLMTDSQMISFLNNVITDLIKSDYLHILREEHIQENSKFMSIVLFVIFEKIAKVFSQFENSLMKCISKEFDIVEILGDKSNIIQKISDVINKQSDTITVYTELNTALLNTFLNALTQINLPYFDSTEKVVVFLFISCFAGDLHKSFDVDKSLLNCCENILIGLLETGPSINMEEYFVDTTCLKLTYWFSKAPLIMSPIIEISLKDSSYIIVDKLLSAIKILAKKLKNFSKFTELKPIREMCTLPTIVLGLILKMHRKLPEEFKPSMTKLQNKCLNLINKIITICGAPRTEFENEITEDRVCFEKFAELLLPSYIFLVQLYVKKPESRDELEIIPKTLLRYLQYSLDQIRIPNSETEIAQSFISLVIRNQANLPSSTIKNFFPCVWETYFNSHKKDNQSKISTENISVLLQNCTDELFEDIILNLKVNTIDSSENVFTCLSLWINVAETVLSGSKSKIKLNALTNLCQELTLSIIKCRCDETTMVLIFKLFFAISNNHLFGLNSTIIDTILGALLLVPFDNIIVVDNKIAIYRNLCSILQVLLLKRTSMILDRLPVITQCIRFIVKVLCQWSSLNNDEHKEKLSVDRVVLSTLGHLIEKTFRALVKLKRDLSRPAYLLHDLIVELTSHTLLTEVKESLQNCCYQLHTLCDIHAMKYLNTVSEPANRQVFKNIHDSYNKFHVYKGKV